MLDKWIRNIRRFQGVEDKDEKRTAVAIIWSIWIFRSNKVFRNEEFNINGIFIRVKSMIKE